ncbi:GNAT family N-acetyltransferase [Streptomyces sp. TR02-1]|uniref:GNAT family N-acetyltransferase n=1 Tax=Streptomyces sp. TR02-1 TaxID=3385977 RepID=UPI0039A13899
MEIVDHYGLALALVPPDEVADEPWRRAERHIDVARVPDPPDGGLGVLAAHGFLRKPATVTWLAELGPDEDAFLERLPRLRRQDVRRARRHAVAGGLREVVEEPVSPESLDAFFALYAERVADMRFGVPFALGYREAILQGPDKWFGVYAHEASGPLAGACLVREEPERDAAVLRFSAVTALHRRSSLARVLYLSALRVARRKGYRYATLGNEPNLMGHLTKPGLFGFKSGLGFEPIPSHRFGDPDAADEADLVLDLSNLGDPTFLLAYAARDRSGAHAEKPELAGHLFHTGTVDTARYGAPFLAPTTVHRMAAEA